MLSQTMTFEEVRDSVESNHDFISAMAFHYAKSLKAESVRTFSQGLWCDRLTRLAPLCYNY